MILSKSFLQGIIAAIIFILFDSHTDTRMSQPGSSAITPNGFNATSASASIVGVHDNSFDKPIDRSTALRRLEKPWTFKKIIVKKKQHIYFREIPVYAGRIKNQGVRRL